MRKVSECLIARRGSSSVAVPLAQISFAAVGKGRPLLVAFWGLIPQRYV
jgi:hypothetical protein